MTRLLLALWAALLLSVPLTAHPALPDPALVQALARLNKTSLGGLTLSPDGRHVAAIEVGALATAAILIDTTTLKPRVLAKRQRDDRFVMGQTPVAVHWLDPDLLVVDYNNRESVSMDLSGKPLVALGERYLRQLSRQGPMAGWVLAYRDLDKRQIDLVHARTGERRRLALDLPGKTLAWAFDEGGDLRAVMQQVDGEGPSPARLVNWYRSSAQAGWRELQSWPVHQLLDAWFPALAQTGSDVLTVFSRHDRDTLALFHYDAQRREHLEPMAVHPQDDLLFAEGLSEPNLTRVVTAGLRAQTFWFEPRWARLQATVDAALPGRDNLLTGDPAGLALVFSSGDVDPGRWLLLDTRAGTLRQIAEVDDGIQPEAQRPMETWRYAARDGLQIPAYLTRPAGPQDRPRPTVVLVHGGPYVRDQWAWNAEVQRLAQAGYVVFQPQFRGSSGFGRRLEEAGFRQWGRAMQDDISDGVLHLVQRGIADPARVCIVGASYGGYAAMWAAIQSPQHFRCAVSMAGVSDLAEQLAGSWRDDSTRQSRAFMHQRVGDPERDREALDAVSPRRHAARAAVPLLIVHGDLDRRVLPSQSKAMVDALRQAGRPVEWLSVDGAGHTLDLSSPRAEPTPTVMRFLARHLGEDAEPAPPAGAASGAAR